MTGDAHNLVALPLRICLHGSGCAVRRTMRVVPMRVVPMRVVPMRVVPMRVVPDLSFRRTMSHASDITVLMYYNTYGLKSIHTAQVYFILRSVNLLRPYTFVISLSFSHSLRNKTYVARRKSAFSSPTQLLFRTQWDADLP
jgi:hypothetical protein